jgi:hypothetical protein
MTVTREAMLGREMPSGIGPYSPTMRPGNFSARGSGWRSRTSYPAGRAANRRTNHG